MEILTGILFLSTFVEGVIQYIAGSNKYESRPYLRYVSLAIGVGLAVAYKVNIPAMAGISADLPLVNYVVSGVIIGRGSNYLNDVISHFRNSK